MWLNGTASAHCDGGAWFESRSNLNEIEFKYSLVSILRKKNGMVYVLVVHHFMRTNNETGYKYTNFHRNIQQWVQCGSMVQRPHIVTEEPGSNLG